MVPLLLLEPVPNCIERSEARNGDPSAPSNQIPTELNVVGLETSTCGYAPITWPGLNVVALEMVTYVYDLYTKVV